MENWTNKLIYYPFFEHPVKIEKHDFKIIYFSLFKYYVDKNKSDRIFNELLTEFSVDKYTYISKIDCSNKESIETSLKNANITERGFELLNLKENTNESKKSKMKVSANMGVISLSCVVEKERKSYDYNMDEI